MWECVQKPTHFFGFLGVQIHSCLSCPVSAKERYSRITLGRGRGVVLAADQDSFFILNVDFSDTVQVN